MDISELRTQFDEKDFQPESWTKLQEVLGEMESSEAVTEGQLTRLSEIINFEEQLENATVDAMDKMANHLEQRAADADSAINELSQEIEGVAGELEQALENNQ